MKRFFLIILAGISLPVHSQTWSSHHHEPGSISLTDIHFPTPGIGFVTGIGNVFLKTTDGGETWNSIPVSNDLYDVQFINPALGFVCGENGTIMKTTNGGVTWTNLVSGTVDILTEFHFMNQDTGYVLGYNGSSFIPTVYKTINGGVSWTPLGSLGTTNTIHDVVFLHDTLGFLGGMGGARIWTTVDGGTNWTVQNLGTGSSISSIVFLTDSMGYAVGNDGVIYKTTDRGVNWVLQLSPSTEHFREIRFTDQLNGWIVGYNGIILRTIDGGLTWNIVPNPNPNQITNVFMGSSAHGWAVTHNNWVGADILKYGNFYQSDSANIIRGNVFADMNGNCLEDAADHPQLNWFIKAEPGPFYAVTDSAGNYALQVPAGTFQVNQIIPTSYGLSVTPCPGPGYSITFNDYNNDTSGFVFGNDVDPCAYLYTAISSDRRRRCFRNHTTVTYYNLGYDTAYNASVHIDFPQYVIPVSADTPWVLDADSNYVFNVGDIAPQETGTIHIVDSVVCWLDSIRGMTQCTEAWITPSNTCPLPSPLWDSSDVETRAKCMMFGFLRFTLINLGAAMADSAEYRIYMNTALVHTRNYKLGAGDSINIILQSNGQTFRIEADQRPYHPTRSQSNATVEACAPESSGNYVYGFVAQLPQDDEDPETSIHCLPIRDSYDPNEKTVSPSGISANHYVNQDQELNYHICFQNTGTDTAFTIAVIDTLSALLDISSIQFGTSSHPYAVTFIQAPVPVIKFTFSNILLPDSNTNEPGSHGFVRFTIRPDSGLPAGTVIRNHADIYFDFNLPVRTDTAMVTLYDTVATGNYNDTIITHWPVALGSGTICIGDTADLFMLGNGPWWWSTTSNPADTLGTSSILTVSPTVPTYYIGHSPDGSDTVFVNVINCPIGLMEPHPEIAVNLYPNPAVSEIAFFSGSSTVLSHIWIYDALGNCLFEQVLKTNAGIIPVKYLSPGIYSVIFKMEEGPLIPKKLVINK